MVNVYFSYKSKYMFGHFNCVYICNCLKITCRNEWCLYVYERGARLIGKVDLGSH